MLPWSSKNRQKLRLSPTSLLNTTYWRVWFSLLQRKDLHSSIIETHDKEYCPGTMNICFIRDRLEQKKLSAIPWHGLVLYKMLNNDYLCSPCQVCQMTKKERKKHALLPLKIADSDTVSLGHDFCGSRESIYNNDTSQNTLSACTHNDRSSNQHRSVWNCQNHK
jgi:hypothetical protein